MCVGMQVSLVLPACECGGCEEGEVRGEEDLIALFHCLYKPLLSLLKVILLCDLASLESLDLRILLEKDLGTADGANCLLFEVALGCSWLPKFLGTTTSDPSTTL